MSQYTIKELAKALNRSYPASRTRMFLLVEYQLARLVSPSWKNSHNPVEAVYELLVPIQALIDEPETAKVAKAYGYVIEKAPKPSGMSDFTRFCANPFNIGGNHGQA
jgi:hypothetical protein